MSSMTDQVDHYLQEGHTFADTKGNFDATGFDKQDIGAAIDDIEQWKQHRKDVKTLDPEAMRAKIVKDNQIKDQFKRE